MYIHYTCMHIRHILSASPSAAGNCLVMYISIDMHMSKETYVCQKRPTGSFVSKS